MLDPVSTDPHTPVPHRAAGALAVQADQEFWTDQQQAALAHLGLADVSNGDLAVFLTYAQRTGLDPWARQIYMVARWDGRTQSNKYTIQAGIDGLRIVALRTGDYAGQVGPEWCGTDGQWRDVWLSPEAPAAARVGVLRRGWAQPQYAVALFREYVGTTKNGDPTKMWAEKPALMIAKCAEALALRKAFPQDLSGIYTGDEMSKADAPAGAPARPAAPPVAPAPALDPDAVRQAILGASTRDDLKARLMGVGAADPKAGWHRADLEALTVADTDGTEASGWDLFAARWMDLDPALAQVVDAEVVEDDTATPDASSGGERREPAPRPDPARRHPAMAAAMATVRAHAHTDETPEEQA